MAVRGPCGESCADVNDSPARNTGLPAATISGPPPIAPAMPPHAGLSVKRNAIVLPTGAAATRPKAFEPVAWSTAPPGGIGVFPVLEDAALVTAPLRSAFGVTVGNCPNTTSAALSAAGVVAPYARVKSA